MPLACAYLKLGGAVEKENRWSLLLGLGEVRAASPLVRNPCVAGSKLYAVVGNNKHHDLVANGGWHGTVPDLRRI